MVSLINNLRALVGAENVLTEPDELLVYECDGLPHHKYRPRAVVFPSSTAETADVMRVLAAAGVPFTPRGAGTGLSGGALALNEGVVIELARMRKVLKVDVANSSAVVQTGVVNLHVSRAVSHLGLHYVPDPSSQPTCTIGGNVAENAGGIHCLKYGTTTDHVLGLRVVLAGGEIVDLGGGTEAGGYDLLGVFIGSEGTFGIATEATLRLVPIPPTVRTLLAEFEDVNNASHAVSAIIAAGVMPAALEMMDREIIRAVEASVFTAGLSLDIDAALLIELDGIEAGIDDEADRVKSICIEYGARSCRSAENEAERLRLWAARKSAFGAVSRISPDSMIQDAVVPRSRLPQVLADAYRISAKYQLRLANVFHAGDGNLHPLICFDSRWPEQVHRVKEAGRELMETCVRAGGSITGEHGVGFDKRELLSLVFSEDDMDTMLRVRAAFDPSGLCNPGKIIPMLRGCGEARAVVPDNGNSEVSEPGALPREISQPPTAPVTRKSFDPAPAQQQLLSIVGATNISTETFAPSLFVTPESIEQVCEVMKLASADGWTVVPAGACTWLEAGNIVEPINIVLSTQNLNRIIEHEPADLVAITEAGVTLQSLNDELGQKGQWLPLDPPDDGRSTIGGVVATGLGGAQQFGYGAPRRHVIGMKVVRTDGRLIKVGGRVVKNVAGYDLSKLFTGSYGTLGVIVEVNFKLRPIPYQTRTILALGDREGLLEAGRQVIASKLFPVAVELLSPALSTLAGVSEPRHVLLVKFDGSHNGVEYQAKMASAIIGSNGSSQAQLIANDVSVWLALAAMPLTFTDNIVARVSVKPADLASIISPFETEDRAWQASVGTGHMRIIGPSRDETMSLRRAAEKLGGSLIIEQAPPDVKHQMDAWGELGDSTDLMQRIKKQLDPDRLLAPGRYSSTI